MIDIHFEKPYIDPRKTPEQNLATLDRWLSEFINNMNLVISKINREIDDGK